MEQKNRKVKLTWQNYARMELLVGRVVGAIQFATRDTNQDGFFITRNTRDNERNILAQTFTFIATDAEWTEIKNFLCNDEIIGPLIEIVEE